MITNNKKEEIVREENKAEQLGRNAKKQKEKQKICRVKLYKII